MLWALSAEMKDFNVAILADTHLVQCCVQLDMGFVCLVFFDCNRNWFWDRQTGILFLPMPSLPRNFQTLVSSFPPLSLPPSLLSLSLISFSLSLSHLSLSFSFLLFSALFSLSLFSLSLSVHVGKNVCVSFAQMKPEGHSQKLPANICLNKTIATGVDQGVVGGQA